MLERVDSGVLVFGQGHLSQVNSSAEWLVAFCLLPLMRPALGVLNSGHADFLNSLHRQKACYRIYVVLANMVIYIP